MGKHHANLVSGRPRRIDFVNARFLAAQVAVVNELSIGEFAVIAENGGFSRAGSPRGHYHHARLRRVRIAKRIVEQVIRQRAG
jgi:hypothetical protein